MKLRLWAAVVAFVGVLAGTAYALNPPVGANFPARQHTTQQVSYFRVLVNFNDPNIAAGVQFGNLPANAVITDVQVEIVTAFNASSTNVLTIGTNSTANQIVATGDVDETATGVTKVTRGLGRSLTSSGVTGLWAKYTQSGDAATAGVAVVTIAYIADNDQ